MKDCGDHSVNIRLHLNNELTGPALENFLAHLKKCVTCRERLSAEWELTSLLHGLRPLHSASDALRSRVISALADPLLPTTPDKHWRD
jgi:hypothetical protein